MTSILIIALFTILQFCMGFGVLSLVRIRLRPAVCIPLSILIGVAIFSIVPFLLQLVFVPLSATGIFAGLITVCILINFKSKQQFNFLVRDIRSSYIRLKLYEVPFLLVVSLMVFISVWRCFYYPPTPRDLTSGAEVIAQYALQEKTMINSVFTVDLTTTNNQFKPPFITCLQIIYKYAGFPFGQIWLSTVFVCFLVFLYHALTARVHKIIAGLLLIMFIAIPEMYAYTFMALFDYSNAVFFCLATYFLFEFFKAANSSDLILSGLLMGIATYMRPETLILAILLSTSILFHYKSIKGWKKPVQSVSSFLLPSIIIYLLSITVYINFYLPSAYKIETLLNKHLLNVSLFFNRFDDMNKKILFSADGINYYGYFIFLFVAVLLFDTFQKNGGNKTWRNWLFGILVVYFGLPFIGYLFPLYDLDNSTKRGLFKIFPLMLLFMGNSRFLISVSERIKKWE
jgi:hypothetical protein